MRAPNDQGGAKVAHLRQTRQAQASETLNPADYATPAI